MRWEYYLEIKKLTKDRSSEPDKYYITKNEMKYINNNIDLYKMRLEVFKLFEIPVQDVNIDPPHVILKRAHYTYINDQDFDNQIKNMKQQHIKYMELLFEDHHLCSDLEDFYTEHRLAEGEKSSDGKVHPLDT